MPKTPAQKDAAYLGGPAVSADPSVAVSCTVTPPRLPQDGRRIVITRHVAEDAEEVPVLSGNSRRSSSEFRLNYFNVEEYGRLAIYYEHTKRTTVRATWRSGS